MLRPHATTRVPPESIPRAGAVTARGLLTRQDPKRFLFFTRTPNGRRAGKEFLARWRNAGTTATRPSRSAHSAPSSSPPAEGASRSSPPSLGGQAIGVTGPPDPAFAKQLGAPNFIGVVMGLLSRKVRKQARKLGVSYSFLFMQ